MKAGRRTAAEAHRSAGIPSAYFQTDTKTDHTSATMSALTLNSAKPYVGEFIFQCSGISGRDLIHQMQLLVLLKPKLKRSNKPSADKGEKHLQKQQELDWNINITKLPSPSS